LKKINQSATKVVIVGDKKDLDKVKEIETIPYDISKITSTHTDTLSLNLPEGIQVFQGISTLTVEFVVENIIESTVRIPINVINPREGYSYSNSVPDVSLTLRGAESVINSFDTSSISAIVDVNNLDVGQHNIDFKINLPSGVSVVKKVPDKISVTITKPEQEVTSP
jgi:YbbR domain-containing protein